MQELDVMLSGGISVDTNFLKAHAERCRLLAENADPFTKRRLLDLAAHYDKRLKLLSPRPPRALSQRRFILPRHQSKSELHFYGGNRHAPLMQDRCTIGAPRTLLAAGV